MNEKKNAQIRLIALSGMFAAMITVMTTFIRIPAPHNGYTHAGDSMIYLAAIILPAPYSTISAAIGGAMADILAGAPEWAFATAIIKSLNTLPFIITGCYLKKRGIDNEIVSVYNIAMLIPTSLITIIGYYIAEGIMFGFEASLAVTLFSGWVQPIAAALVYFIIGRALDGFRFKERIYEGSMAE